MYPETAETGSSIVSAPPATTPDLREISLNDESIDGAAAPPVAKGILGAELDVGFGLVVDGHTEQAQVNSAPRGPAQHPRREPNDGIDFAAGLRPFALTSRRQSQRQQRAGLGIENDPAKHHLRHRESSDTMLAISKVQRSAGGHDHVDHNEVRATRQRWCAVLIYLLLSFQRKSSWQQMTTDRPRATSATMRFAMSHGSDSDSDLATSLTPVPLARRNPPARRRSSARASSTDYLDLNPPPRLLDDQFPAISPSPSPSASPSKARGNAAEPTSRADEVDASEIDYSAIQAETDRIRMREPGARFESDISTRLGSLQDQVADLRELVLLLAREGSTRRDDAEKEEEVPGAAQQVCRGPRGRLSS